MTDLEEARRCYGCRVLFGTDDEFWHHILNVDCSSSISSSSLVKDSSLLCSTEDNKPLENKPTNDLEFCALCDKKFLSKAEFLKHSSSPEHQLKFELAARVRSDNNIDVAQSHLFCDVCQVSLPSLQAKDAHNVGKKHKKMCNRQPNSLNLQENSSMAHNTEPKSNQEDLERLVEDCGQSSSTSSESAHLAEKNTDVIPQLHTDGENDVIYLLRRLCLTQILSLLVGINEDSSSNLKDTFNKSQTKHPFKEKDLLELTRAVCREELRAILPQSLQHIVSSQTKNEDS
ncbi:unnamed protein product [Schistosoma turkestanicum]|nr:unnamed protein product [Schistosoma turkestanicum]